MDPHEVRYSRLSILFGIFGAIAAGFEPVLVIPLNVIGLALGIYALCRTCGRSGLIGTSICALLVLPEYFHHFALF